jgi:hypothetical protein
MFTGELELFGGLLCSIHNVHPMAAPSGAHIDCQISHSAAGIKHVANAWRFLLTNGQVLADKFHIKPEELMWSASF